jgi:hypothetical protein
MGSSTISKIEKAIHYAQERDRFEFQTFTVKLHGVHGDHTVTYRDSIWNCDCEHFAGQENCSHTIACEKVLGEMLPGAIPALMN